MCTRVSMISMHKRVTAGMHTRKSGTLSVAPSLPPCSRQGLSLFYIYCVIYTCSWTSEDNMQELVLSFRHESHGLSSGRQAWRSGPLPTEPSDQPSSLACHCVHQVRQPRRFRGSFCFPSQEQWGYTTDL